MNTLTTNATPDAGLFVSAEVADYLDRLLELGVSQRSVQRERDGWIVMQSVAPKRSATAIAHNREGAADGSAAEPAIAQLVATSVGASSPVWDRLRELARERKAGG